MSAEKTSSLPTFCARKFSVKSITPKWRALFSYVSGFAVVEAVSNDFGHEDDNQSGDDAEDDDPFAPILVR